ncbi:family 16 glycosylhydrolase [Thermophagus sp. OGC60D27]|uniref:family 16 glycosylhydrolase n=1 Tax=Thermophagus sp. OGC60D27 TaxID=3458415 RepID=UPI004037C07F
MNTKVPFPISHRFFGMFVFAVWFSHITGVNTIVMAQECSYLVFSDEFDYQGVPKSDYWNYETGGGGWGNNELQTYTNSLENSYVSNGTLKIHARKSPSGAWTSARLVTAGKASWKYGTIEVRAKLPQGVGTWPAIWMMPQNSVYGGWPNSGEIDIMEHVGYDLGMIHGSIHTEAYNHILGTQKTGSIEVEDAHLQFHTYSIQWTPEKITWFVDGVEFFSFSNPHISYKEWPFDQPFFLILNIAIGGNWGGAQGIDPDLTEAVMEIDYVRVYQSTLPDLSVKGPDKVQPGEEVTFSVTPISGVAYQWSFPRDVQVISDENSNEVTVEWGSESGIVQCKMISDCEEKTASPLSVNLYLVPEEAPLVLAALNDDITPAWIVPEQSGGNSFFLEPSQKGVKVSYSIVNPLENPYISLSLNYIVNLEDYRTARVNLKVLDGDVPNVLRFDFVDRNGKVNTSDLFKVTSVVDDQEYHIYQHTFEGSVSTWNMAEIVEVRLYVNYGITGQKGEGSFELGDIQLAPPGFFTDIPDFVPNTLKISSLKLWPNPVKNYIYFELDNHQNGKWQIFAQNGQFISQGVFTAEERKIKVPDLMNGLYFIRLINDEGKIFVGKVFVEQ